MREDTRVGQEIYGEFLYFPLSFALNPKLIYKKVIIKKINNPKDGRSKEITEKS